MCYDSFARPPFPTERVGGAKGEDLVLTAADGNQFNAFIARAEKPKRGWVVILPDVRGLHQFYKDLALLFGEAGYNSVAVDYFGRTAGLTPRDDAFEFMPHVVMLQAAGIEADFNAAISTVRAEAADAPIVTVGFCMGGSLSYWPLPTSRSIWRARSAFMQGFHGREAAAQPPYNRPRAIRIPVLGLFGGADQGIPVSDVEQLDQALDRAGVPHEIKIYPGAPHSFFDRKWTEFADASADAWTRILGFIDARA